MTDWRLPAAAGELAQALYRADCAQRGCEPWPWVDVQAHRKQGYFEIAVRTLRSIAPTRETGERDPLFVYASELAREEAAKVLAFQRSER